MKVHITGFQAVYDQIKKKDKSASNALRNALSSAARHVTTQYRRILTPRVRTGAMLRAAMFKVQSKKKVFAVIGPKMNYVHIMPSGKRHIPGKIAHLLEDGTKIRKTKKGKNRGKVKPYKYLTRAYNPQEVFNKIAKSMQKALQ